MSWPTHTYMYLPTTDFLSSNSVGVHAMISGITIISCAIKLWVLCYKCI